MSAKIYSSFKQLETDLEILKLEKEIEYQKMIHSIEKSSESLSSKNVITNLVGSVVAKIANPYVAMAGTILPTLINEGIPLVKSWLNKKKEENQQTF